MTLPRDGSDLGRGILITTVTSKVFSDRIFSLGGLQLVENRTPAMFVITYQNDKTCHTNYCTRTSCCQSSRRQHTLQVTPNSQVTPSTL